MPVRSPEETLAGICRNRINAFLFLKSGIDNSIIRYFIQTINKYKLWKTDPTKVPTDSSKFPNRSLKKNIQIIIDAATKIPPIEENVNSSLIFNNELSIEEILQK